MLNGGAGLIPDTQSPFVQLSQIHLMSNNVPSANTNLSNYPSQQDIRKIPNGKPHQQLTPHHLSSLPRHATTRQQESTLNQNHYSQPVGNGGPIGIHKSATTDRHIRLTQDHFNHNHHHYGKQNTFNCGPGGGGGGGALPDPNYIHNNSHYSLPLDHNLPPSPTPTPPPPPALPIRNGSCGGSLMMHSNTTGRRSFTNSNGNANGNLNNNNNNNSTALNNNNSLRRYH